MPRRFGGPGVPPSNNSVQGYANEINLQAGEAWLLSELANGASNGGEYMFQSTSGAARAQVYDPIPGIWRAIGALGASAGHMYVNSEGNNYRLANQSGCAVGAFVITKGSGYTSPPQVVPSAGGSKWAAVVGGILTSVNVLQGGSAYLYPPIVIFDAPPTYAATGIPGFMATGYATLTAGVVTSITLTDLGAGYTSAPNVWLINDPRDTSGSGASAQAVVGGAGQLTGVVCIDHGNPVSTLPTLTISGGGGTLGAATVLMDWAVTGVTVGGGGTGFPTSGIVGITPFQPALTGAAWTNPAMETNLVISRRAELTLPSTGGGALTATGALGFGGSYSALPVSFGTLTSALITGAPTLTFTVGGVADTVFIAQV